MNKLVKTVPNTDLYIEFLKSLNGILGLTEREIELMAVFIKLDIEYPKLPGLNKNVANTINRKYIINSMHVTRDNLSRYIKRFREKGLLVAGKAEDELMVNKILIPEIIADRVQITITIETNK